MSRTILTQVGKILPLASDKVPEPMRRRSPVREVLNRRMTQTGKNPPAIARRAAEKGLKVTDSAIKQILTGSTTNPGLFTVEAIEAGMDLLPMELIAELLGQLPKQTEPKSSQLAKLPDIYRTLTPTQKAKADIHIEALLIVLQYIKNQTR